MSNELYAYTGRVSRSSGWAPILDQHNIREMTNRGQTPARTPFALDNGAYVDWRSEREFDEPAYRKTLKGCIPLKPDFIIIPDKVAGGLESLWFSLSWIPELRKMTRSSTPLALAVQDGMEPRDIEPYLGQFEVLFLGGSRPWKYRTGEQWCRWAENHGLPVHIGAIGSMVGVRWAKAIHATSVDSTSPLWSKKAMANWLHALEETPAANAPIITPRINPNNKLPKLTRKGNSREDIVGSTVAESFHQKMMGDVKITELNEIRRAFGDAHLRGKISDNEFLDLEATASAVYDLLRLENLTLPPFTPRTVQSQENLDRWTEQLSETDDYRAFKYAYADLERAYRNKSISAFDTVTLQTMCRALFKRFFAKQHPGGFGDIVAPNALVAGVKKKGKTHRVGAMRPTTNSLVELWRQGEDIAWRGSSLGINGYMAMIDTVRDVASDPEAPSEFLEWLYHQNRNARTQLPSTAVDDIPPYITELLSNPSVSANFALQLAGNQGYGNHTNPFRILGLLKNLSFELFTLEDPDYMNKVFELIRNIHPIEIPATLAHFRDIPAFDAWIGPEVGHYTFNHLHKTDRNRFGPHQIPESVIVYGNGVVDLNYRTIKENKTSQRLYRTLSDAEKKYGSGFLSLSDQVLPKHPKAKPPKSKISGLPRMSRIGALSTTTQILLDLWRQKRVFDPYNVIPELGDKQPRALDEEMKEAASSYEVPSDFLIWLLDNYDFWIQKEVIQNPNLSLEDAFIALDERRMPHHWARSKRYSYAQSRNYETITGGVWLLDNPSFQLFLLEDPNLYDRLFSAVQNIGKVANKEVYRDKVDAFLSHPVMQPWLGGSTVYTFKKAKRAPLDVEPDRAMFPLAITLYQNGVIRVEHTLSERKERTPLFRTLKEYLDNPSFSRPMSEAQFLAKSDQASAKRKGK